MRCARSAVGATDSCSGSTNCSTGRPSPRSWRWRTRCPGAARPIPALPLYKALLLKEWYGLSNEALEDELWERDSFRRCCGFRAADQIPDHTTLCRFRNELARRGLGEPLFAELQRQLAARHVILQQGRASIDAGLVEAQGARPRAGAKQPPSDPDAARVRRRNVSYHGCKMHLNVDLDTRLIAAALLTPANVHETRVADQLLTGQERSVHADRAYDRKSRRALYAERGIACNLRRLERLTAAA